MRELDNLITELNDETNGIAARVDALTAELQSTQGAAPSAESIAKLRAVSARLKSLGANPTDPIPPPVPA